MGSDDIYRLADRVVMESFEDGALLLRLEDRHFLDLNTMACDILTRTDGYHSVALIASALAETYQVPQEQVLQDVEDLYRQLSTQRVVEKSSSSM